MIGFESGEPTTTDWLLHGAIECSVPIWQLSNIDVLRVVVMPSHPSSDGQRLGALQALAEAGLVELRPSTAGIPLKAAVAAGSFGDPRRCFGSACYALTARGGRRWEQVFRPRWSNRILTRTASHSGHPGRVIEVEAKTRHAATAFADAVARRSRGQYTLSLPAPVSPWRVTYWKQFDIGWRVVMTPSGEVDESPFQFTIPGTRWNWHRSACQRR